MCALTIPSNCASGSSKPLPELIKTCQRIQVCHHMVGNLGMFTSDAGNSQNHKKEKILMTNVWDCVIVFSKQAILQHRWIWVGAFLRFVFSLHIIKFHQMSGFCQQECFTFIFYIWLTNTSTCARWAADVWNYDIWTNFSYCSLLMAVAASTPEFLELNSNIQRSADVIRSRHLNRDTKLSFLHSKRW